VQDVFAVSETLFADLGGVKVAARPLIAIDPGNEFSAYVFWDGKALGEFGKIRNEDLLFKLTCEWATFDDGSSRPPLHIEMIASYGMAVGREVFETCVWIGRFMEAYGGATLVFRRDIKLHLCESMKAKDSNVIQALKDRFGDKGTKAAPGLTYGLKADIWQAFALAVYAFDKEVSR
jgi:hypothetical protein